jgi:hypothetical protein
MTLRLPTLLVAALLAVSAMAVPVHHALACTCAGPMTREEAMAAAHVAFIGVAVAVHDPSGADPFVSSAEPVVTTFVVEEMLKGTFLPTLDVTSSRDGASCGAGYAAGQRWFVTAAHSADGMLSSHLCAGNELLAEGVPAPPVAEAGDPATQGDGLPIGPIAVGALAIGLAVLSLVAFGRRPRRGSA